MGVWFSQAPIFIGIKKDCPTGQSFFHMCYFFFSAKGSVLPR